MSENEAKMRDALIEIADMLRLNLCSQWDDTTEQMTLYHEAPHCADGTYTYQKSELADIADIINEAMGKVPE